ncbi:MAG TPA: L-threonylcarbamoyladenylate synthase [Anaerolineales bacterium]
MDTRIIDARQPGALETAEEILKAGSLIAFPTDTVYGLGALAFDEEAVRSIYAAKGRSEEKAIPILLGDAADLDRVAHSLPPTARRLARRFWPGPLTLVVRKRADLPSAVSSTNTVGVRVPDHAVARALLRRSGPLAVTSANVSGQASPRTAGEVLQQLGGRIPLILDGGPTPGGIPSTVLDCTQPEPVVLRAGPLALDDIMAALE